MINADGILLQTKTGSNCRWLLEEIENHPNKRIKLIVATSSHECFADLEGRSDVRIVRVPAWHAGQMAKVGQVIAHSLQEGHVSKGERLVCLFGDGCADSTDLIKVWDVTGEEYVAGVLSNRTLAATVELAIELATTTIDGKPIGAAFMIGDSKNVLRLSYQLMIDPFQNHRANIKDRRQWELVKKYAGGFDGAFVIDSDGTIAAAHRFLNANTRCNIPKGLGTRHHAVGAMTAATSAKGITVSQEDRLIRIFEGGEIVARVNPRGRVVECLKDSV
jgi:DNA integrity scanning protein DisA with diadenylate cyclase activity